LREASSDRRGGDEDIYTLLRQLGGALYDGFVTNQVRAAVAKLLASGSPYRLLLGLPPQLMSVPFEVLYSTEHRQFLALSQRCSFVRFIDTPMAPQGATLSLPLRVLAVLSSPSDTAPINVEGELEVLNRTLKHAIDAERVRLLVLQKEKATREGLQSALRTFRPHVFHFSGHGIFQGSQGAIVLHGALGAVEVVASDVATLLRDAGVRIAILNGCDTGRSHRNDAISSVAGALANDGVAAVIATTREVRDEAALLFARDFYRTLSEGFPVEAALAEARKALSVEHHDWSVYALYASTPQLDALEIPAVPAMRHS
jgi:CHAT domain-containing protein